MLRSVSLSHDVLFDTFASRWLITIFELWCFPYVIADKQKKETD